MKTDKNLETGTYPDQPPPYEGPSGQLPMPPHDPAVVQTTVATEEPILGRAISPMPTELLCPSCNEVITTRVESKPSMRTHILSALLCVIGGLLCVFIPYCVKSCNNAHHYCPNCGAYIASYVA